MADEVTIRLDGRGVRFRPVTCADRDREAAIQLHCCDLYSEFIARIRMRIGQDCPTRAERLQAADMQVAAVLQRTFREADDLAQNEAATAISAIFGDLLPAGDGEQLPEVPKPVMIERLARARQCRLEALTRLMRELAIEPQDRKDMPRLTEAIRTDVDVAMIVHALTGGYMGEDEPEEDGKE